MPRRSLTIEQILTMLAETPRRIAALTAGLTRAQLHAGPKREEWSVNGVLAHLHACGDVWGGNIMAMLDEETPILRDLKQIERIINMHPWQQPVLELAAPALEIPCL